MSEMSWFTKGKIFTGAGTGWATDLVVSGERLLWVGSAEGAARIADGVVPVDLQGRVVLPGFTDAHTHLVEMGTAQQKVGLVDADSLVEIQSRVRQARRAEPDGPRVLGRSWLFGAVPGGQPTRHMLDEAVEDVPVYLDANDLHSTWVNSAALRELGITRDTPDPAGGRIGRDAEGEPDGMLFETAVTGIYWPRLHELQTDEYRDRAIDATLTSYLAAGVTGAVDMALTQPGLDALERARSRFGGELPIHIAAHWLVEHRTAEEDLAVVRRAAALMHEHRSGSLRVVGIKLILDGVIDACTAAVSQPYSDGTTADTIWPREHLERVVVAADAAGLQIAMHAIGDSAVAMALDALEAAHRANGPRLRRHRIEHLEVVDPRDVRRVAELGVVASMQPVHCDPAVNVNWRRQLGDFRIDRGYAWREFDEAGATLAFGTDAPVSPHEALHNVFVAATRRSSLDPSLPGNIPALALPLERAIAHSTLGAAFSCGQESERGSLEVGKLADFIVIDADPFADGPSALLTASVMMTAVRGRVRFERT